MEPIGTYFRSQCQPLMKKYLKEPFTDINRLLTECLCDNEIMKQLDIPKTTYYRYKAMLHREAAEEFKKQRLDDLALHKELLEG
jgi:hypothetical protein